MGNTLWFAYLLAYTIAGNPYAAGNGGNPRTTSGSVERIEEILGPVDATKEACEKYADKMREVKAKELKLPDKRLLKYECVELMFPATVQ